MKSLAKFIHFHPRKPVCKCHQSPVNSPHKGQWRLCLMFSLICIWINGWVNNRKPGDLSRHPAHYDVTVMLPNNLPVMLLSWYYLAKCYGSGVPPMAYIKSVIWTTVSHKYFRFCYNGELSLSHKPGIRFIWMFIFKLVDITMSSFFIAL